MSTTDEKTIGALLGTKLVVGDTWYLVEQQWFDRFCAHHRVDPTTFAPVSGSAGPAPGPIRNASLLDPNKNPGELVRSVNEGMDFSYVHSSLWDIISKQHGFDVAVPRKVVQVGLRKTETIEMHPCYLSIYYPDASGEAEKKRVEAVSSYSVLKDLSLQFCPLEQKVEGRLWRDSANWRLIPASEMGMTLQVADLPDNCLLFEYQQEGKWPRAHKEEVKRAWNDFKVDDIIDAKDTEGKWYESRIVDVKDEQVLVHYNGWSTKWDEWHQKTSARLAEKNSHTTGPYSATSRNSGYSNYSSSYSMNESTKPKVQGVVGLRNLGNTCFMNSTLQCLSNTVELTDYFISKHYVKELNRTNPLGWGGKIAEAYAGLMEDMWGNQYSVVTPSTLKHTIGEFQPRFSGYQQHDSSELLSFLLDGLHEDLNRVLKKPATEAVDSKGRDDAVVARESWDRHLLRNQSVIVDKFQGQLKSKVVCPDCKRDSVTFDPFMFLSVPLPQTGTEKQQRVTLVRAASARTQPMQYAVNIPPLCSTRDLLKNLCDMVPGLPVENLIMAEVYTGGIYKFFKSKDPVDRIAARDEIFVYEVALPSDAQMDSSETEQARPPAKLLQLVHLTTGQYSSILEKFGLPLVLAVPGDRLEQMPIDLLRQAVFDVIAPFVDFASDGFGRYYDIRITGDTSERYLSREDPHATHINLKLSTTSYGGTYTSEHITLGLAWTEEGKRHYFPPKEAARHESAAKISTVFDEDSNGVRATLDDCLAEFTKEETLAEGDEWYCSSCKAHKRAKKQFSIYSAPTYLIIHLKRFSYNRYWRDKIGTLVDFPLENLDMSNWLVQKSGAPATYDLYAVSNHMGNLGGGHYTAYGKNCVDGNWYNFNDSSVSPVENLSQIKSTSAYVLFYKRRSAKA